jgi:addiction module HigA family antidote
MKDYWSMETVTKLLHNPHPGETLLEDCMKPLGITAYRLAKDIDVPTNRIDQITAGKRSISADTALRLGAYFKTSPQFWLNLQTQYDLAEAQRSRPVNVKPRESLVVAKM